VDLLRNGAIPAARSGSERKHGREFKPSAINGGEGGSLFFSQ